MHFARILPIPLLVALALAGPGPGAEDQPRPAPQTIAVKHTPRQENGWARAETTNFRIFHNESRKTAEKVARIAETTRATQMRKWFGKTVPAWTSKCDIYLHATGEDYARETKAPAHVPGHASITRDSERVVSMRVDLHCDEPNMLTAVLPHETTHVILAGRFGRHSVPRWVDEGVAVLSEPRERIDWHLRWLPKHDSDGTLFKVGKLMGMSDYPHPRLLGPFYAQSVSLVEYLSKKKGSATFARFVREGLDKGYEASLKRHYGYRSFADLDRDWRKYAFGEGAAATE
jgi:hypothetical protein